MIATQATLNLMTSKLEEDNEVNVYRAAKMERKPKDVILIPR